MKRRLDLAAALIHNPEVLFLYEPASGLDPVSRARMWDEVRRLNAELGMTIFLTTQYLEEADERSRPATRPRSTPACCCSSRSRT
jgi:ABC-2 type transport system ATP-binding protein